LETPDPSAWRRIFLDSAPPPTEERFFPLRSRKGLTSGEHFARYLFAARYCQGKRVLDIACGPGYGAYILKILGAGEVVGVDRDRETVDFASRTYGSAGLDFHACDAAALDLELAPFDVIVSFETIEHLENVDPWLETLKRRLGPEGLLIISCPHDARSPWVSPFHVRHYTYPEFRQVVARHFPDPVAVSQLHGAASLILPAAAAQADDLSRVPLPETYLDFRKTVEDSDIFLLLGGTVPDNPQPLAVITKNLSEFLREIYAGVEYMRERFPRLEAELTGALETAGRQGREILSLHRALDEQKARARGLEHDLQAMYYSRTWQLMLACREAIRSPLELLRLPLRLARIFLKQPGP